MTYRLRIVLGVAMALLGLLVAAFGLRYGTFSARGYVKDHYTRVASHDIGRDAVAYSSPLPPQRVAAKLTGAFSPADRYVDSSGYYLRYNDDSVVIRPLAAGSLILVERMTTAYPRYHGIVGSAWGSGRGSTVRGGGPGAGK